MYLQVLMSNVNLLRNVQVLNTRRVRLCSLGRHTHNGGWYTTVNREYNEERFKQVFRVSRATFNHILEQILPFIRKEDTGMGSI